MNDEDEGIELLRDLIAAGTAPELVARVARLLTGVNALAKRRAADAARQRQQRERARGGKDR